MVDKPPPILGNGRVLEYAIVGDSVKYLGDSSLFVGDPAGRLKELGPVPCLAITKDLKTGEISLLHCDDQWDLLATRGKYASVDEAKTRAERTYRGISSQWIDAKISEDEALKYRDTVWADYKCSFCGKIPPDVEMIIKRDGTQICDSCIEEFHSMLQQSQAKS